MNTAVLSPILEITVSTPLTCLSEDESLMRETVRRFAQDRTAPLTHAMDEAQKMDPGLIEELFAMA